MTEAGRHEPAGDPGRIPAPKNDRRERILVVAERLFAERGYEHVSVRDIAAAARVTHPLIYYHWGSKRGLLAAVLERNRERVSSLVAGQTGPRETILAIIASYLNEGRLYLLILARSFLGGMPVADWPGGYPGLEAAIRVLRASGPADDPRWEEEVRGVVSLLTAMLCGWVLMGEEILDAADVRSPQRERAPERLLSAIDALLGEALARRDRL